MNKDELVSAVSEKSGVSKKDTLAAVNALLETIKNSVSEGNSVSLIGFGIFEARKRAARKGINPSTGAPITIPARTVPTFRAGSKFKSVVNEG